MATIGQYGDVGEDEGVATNNLSVDIVSDPVGR